MQFQDLIKKIQGQFSEDVLDFFVAKDFVFDAWTTIRKSRPWSFNMQQGVWYSPGLINAGTVSFTQFFNSFQLNATAQTAWNAAGVNPPVNQRQIRFGTVASTGKGASVNTYSILDYNGVTGAGHTVSIILEPTSTSSMYQMFRSLYGPPWTNAGLQSTDAVYQIEGVADPVNNYSFIDVTLTRADLNREDIQRSAAQGNPYYLASAPYDVNGVPQWEMYPFPTNAIPYVVDFTLVGGDPALTDNIPARLNTKLLRELSMVEACKWAMKQPALRGADWRGAMTAHQKDYDKLWIEEARNDEEINMTALIKSPPTNLIVGDDERTGYYNIPYK